MTLTTQTLAQASLCARGIFKDYGTVKVLKDVSISVAPGTTHAVIGPNGAGKTTLFRVLSGEALADRGEVAFEEQDVSRWSGYRRVRQGIGRTFQVAKVFSEMRVIDNVVLALETGGSPALRRSVWRFVQPAPAAALRTQAMASLATVGLEARAGEMAGVLAYGERKRLELAMALALQPRMLLLDEPMAGMSPGDRISAVALLKRIGRELGMSILLTEHDMSVVFALADHITVLNYGQVIASGTPEAVRASPIVREVYLGHEHA